MVIDDSNTIRRSAEIFLAGRLPGDPTQDGFEALSKINDHQPASFLRHPDAAS